MENPQLIASRFSSGHNKCNQLEGFMRYIELCFIQPQLVARIEHLGRDECLQGKLVVRKRKIRIHRLSKNATKAD